VQKSTVTMFRGCLTPKQKCFQLSRKLSVVNALSQRRWQSISHGWSSDMKVGTCPQYQLSCSVITAIGQQYVAVFKTITFKLSVWPWTMLHSCYLIVCLAAHFT